MKQQYFGKLLIFIDLSILYSLFYDRILLHPPPLPSIKSAHEYTAANAKFAVSVEPGNTALMERATKIYENRKHNIPTVPSQLGLEKLTNPFLRCDMSDEIRKNVGVLDGKDSDEDAFAKVRIAKDNFRG